MKKSLLAAALLASALAGGTAVAGAGDGGATATNGQLHRFEVPAAPTSLEGHASMVRTAAADTIVDLHVRGLEANTTYGAHVHAKPCDDGMGGGHYVHDTVTGGGSVQLPNEIWPGPFTTNSAGVGHGRVVVPVVAGPAAVSVVVHAPGGAKIACADLADAAVVVPE